MFKTLKENWFSGPYLIAGPGLQLLILTLFFTIEDPFLIIFDHRRHESRLKTLGSPELILKEGAP